MCKWIRKARSYSSSTHPLVSIHSPDFLLLHANRASPFKVFCTKYMHTTSSSTFATIHQYYCIVQDGPDRSWPQKLHKNIYSSKLSCSKFAAQWITRFESQNKMTYSLLWTLPPLTSLSTHSFVLQRLFWKIPPFRDWSQKRLEQNKFWLTRFSSSPLGSNLFGSVDLDIKKITIKDFGVVSNVWSLFICSLQKFKTGQNIYTTLVGLNCSQDVFQRAVDEIFYLSCKNNDKKEAWHYHQQNFTEVLWIWNQVNSWQGKDSSRVILIHKSCSHSQWTQTRS